MFKIEGEAGLEYVLATLLVIMIFRGSSAKSVSLSGSFCGLSFEAGFFAPFSIDPLFCFHIEIHSTSLL